MIKSAALVILLTALTGLPDQATAGPSGNLQEILKGMDDLWRGRSSSGRSTLEVKTGHYRRTMTMDYWSLGEDYFLVRIAAPKRERGTATLKRGDEIYNYLPKAGRVIKIGAAMMGGSWMGSHLTNDDLVQSSRLADDYTATLVSDKPDGKGNRTLEISLVPHKDAAVVWGKQLVQIRMPGYIPLLQKFFDEDLQPAREIRFANIRDFSGRKIPATMTVLPANKPGEFTRFTYEQIRFDPPDLNDGFFSLKRLKQ